MNIVKTTEEEFEKLPDRTCFGKYMDLKNAILDSKVDSYLKVDVEKEEVQSIKTSVGQWALKRKISLKFRYEGKKMVIWIMPT